MSAESVADLQERWERSAGPGESHPGDQLDCVSADGEYALFDPTESAEAWIQSDVTVPRQGEDGGWR